MAEQDPVVSYTVKEVLVRLEGKFDLLTQNLLEQVKEISDRVSVLEHERTGRRTLRNSWVTLLTLVAALGASVGTVVLAVTQGH